jgi:hypothetical protein
MPEIQAVLDVTLNELSSEHQLILKEAVEQFQQKCLLSFSKNRSGVPFLKTDMPRVLMPGDTDATTAVEKQEDFAMIRQAMEEIMTRHNTAFLNSFRQMMVGVFGPILDRHFEKGESSATANSQPPRQDASAQLPQQSMSVQPTQHVGSQPILQNPHQAIPNPRTYGEMAFGSTGVQPVSTYRIAQQVTGYKGICTGMDIQSSWTIVLSMLSRILGMVMLQGCLLGSQGIKTPMLIS